MPPVAMQFPTTPLEAPWVTSLSTGRFTITRVTSEGYVGQAFSLCPIEDEDRLLTALYEDTWKISSRAGWSNRCTTVEEAFRRLTAFGYDCQALLVPYVSLSEVVGKELSEEEADQVSFAKGCVAEVHGVKVFSARNALPRGSAILTSSRALTGYYTRIRDHVGVTILHADRSLMLVQNELA